MVQHSNTRTNGVNVRQLTVLGLAYVAMLIIVLCGTDTVQRITTDTMGAYSYLDSSLFEGRLTYIVVFVTAFLALVIFVRSSLLGLALTVLDLLSIVGLFLTYYVVGLALMPTNNDEYYELTTVIFTLTMLAVLLTARYLPRFGQAVQIKRTALTTEATPVTATAAQR